MNRSSRAQRKPQLLWTRVCQTVFQENTLSCGMLKVVLGEKIKFLHDLKKKKKVRTVLHPVLQTEGGCIQGSRKLISNETTVALVWLFSSSFDPRTPFPQNNLCRASILPRMFDRTEWSKTAFLFYSWQEDGPERRSDLPKITQLGRSKAWQKS